MAEPTFAVQKAIYEALSTALNGTASVYDHVPQDAAFPYVSIDAEEAMPRDFLASRRDQRMIYLSVWSRYKGQKEVKEIIAAIDAALHRARLALDTGTMVICMVRRKAVAKDADGKTYMGTITLDVTTTH